MRVISGDKKGFKLKAPKGSNTRPTEDRIKESLFNILRNIKKDSIVLDLFAGSGSIGIEFLSRGAKEAYFIDNSYESINCIKENLNHTNLKDKSKVFKIDAFKGLTKFNNNIKFDYIFADPPYRKGIALKLLKTIDKINVLSESGILIIEHEDSLNLDTQPISQLKRKDYRKYGNKSLSFYSLID